MGTQVWWKNAVIYQIYPRSFMDSNNDGIGDIRGIIGKLDYLEWLGIDAVWICPVYKSPNDDNGYDISDYMDIMDEFGTMADMDELILKAKEKNIRIIMDMVFNHTSDEHKWFIEARKSKDNPYRDYYIWRDPVNGDKPNELGSVFSGSAWQLDETTGQYYLHLFSKRQPDLNWENEAVRKNIIEVIKFWVNKGVSGFRLDMIELLGKLPDEMITANGPKLHDYIKELYREGFNCNGKAEEIVTIGECWAADTDIALKYTEPDNKELSMVFQFEHSALDEIKGKGKWALKEMRLTELKSIIDKWQLQYDKGWNTLFWNNHDLPRIVSRFGNDKEYRVESAKMLALYLYCLKGTPFIYQGEEIGMTNIKFDTIEEYKDIEIHNMYKEKKAEGVAEEDIMKSIYAKGRDNARTPMQWNDEINAGFTKGIPWIKVNNNYKEINVKKDMEDNNSVLHFYQNLIKMRKDILCIREGNYIPLLNEDEDIAAYTRNTNGQGILVIANFHECTKKISFSDIVSKRIIISNYNRTEIDLKDVEIRPYEAVMCEI
ncbi:MAG: alpha-glucosidase [Lachnospiraceae bacterium]|nr:alpha-glucosidase [Lachnospiraceae bacterium]